MLINKLNKKVYQLDDTDWLIEKRQAMSRAKLAQEIGCKPGSIQWAERKLPLDIKSSFVFERRHLQK